MNRREHYLEAERLLNAAGDDHEAVVEILATAQVHATLATVAASVDTEQAS